MTAGELVVAVILVLLVLERVTRYVRHWRARRSARALLREMGIVVCGCSACPSPGKCDCR